MVRKTMVFPLFYFHNQDIGVRMMGVCHFYAN